MYCIGAGLALDGKKVLLIDVDPQGDLTKMLGQRKPHDLPRALGDVMSDVVSGREIAEHTEIMHHHEGFDFVPGNRALSAVEVGLVNVMSRETVLRQYVDSVKKTMTMCCWIAVLLSVCWLLTRWRHPIMFLSPYRLTTWRPRI